MKTTIWTVYIILIAAFALNAKTITIPGDATVLQDAVDMAESGDEILIQTTRVEIHQPPETYLRWWMMESGLIIQNKNLKIIGDTNGKIKISTDGNLEWPITLAICPLYPEEGYDVTNYYDPLLSAIWIENSTVTFENLEIDKIDIAGGMEVSTSPIQLINSIALIKNCNIHCPIFTDSSISIYDSMMDGVLSQNIIRYTPPYDAAFEIPVLYVHDLENAQIEIQDSIINSDEGIVNGAVWFANCRDTIIKISNTSIQAADAKQNSMFGSGYRACFLDGGVGVKIIGSEDCEFDFENSQIVGGKGLKNYQFGIDPFYFQSEEIGFGGAALSILNSNISINNCVCIGGQGAEFNTSIFDDELDYLEIPLETNHCQGGAGLELINSTARIKNLNAIGGKGGPAFEYNGETIILPGKDGPSILLDETSHLNVLSHVEDWYFYSKGI